LPIEYHDVARLWRAYQGGGMGIGYLPDSGGLNDQCSWLIEAFGIMSVYERKLKRP